MGYKYWDDDTTGSSILLDRAEAAELAAIIRQYAPSYTAIAATLEEMSKGEHEVLCLQMLG